MWFRSSQDIVRELKREGEVKSERIESVMVDTEIRKYNINHKYPAEYLERLKNHLFEGETVLYITPGATYVAVCMALMVGESGKVIVINDRLERHQEDINEVKRNRPQLLETNRLIFILSNESQAYPEFGPYSVIFGNGKVNFIPDHLLNKLKPCGRLLIYYQTEDSLKLQQVDKLSNGSFERSTVFNTKYEIASLDNILEKLHYNSNSQQEPADSELNRIKNALKCPVCLMTMIPPTSLCKNGHTICSECKQSLDTCPACRAEYSTMNNITMDEALQELNYNCRGRPNGCRIEMRWKDIKSHEKWCPFYREIKCKVEDCKSRITVFYYCNHMRIAHKNIISPCINFPIKFDFEMNMADWKDLRKIILKEEELTSSVFEFRVKIRGNMLLIGIKYLGPKSMLNKFEVKIQLKLKENEMSRMSRPSPYDIHSSEFWSSHNFEVSKDVCESYLIGKYLHIECFVYKTV